jgi:hypothetical protein
LKALAPLDKEILTASLDSDTEPATIPRYTVWTVNDKNLFIAHLYADDDLASEIIDKANADKTKATSLIKIIHCDSDNMDAAKRLSIATTMLCCMTTRTTPFFTKKGNVLCLDLERAAV